VSRVVRFLTGGLPQEFVWVRLSIGVYVKRCLNLASIKQYKYDVISA